MTSIVTTPLILTVTRSGWFAGNISSAREQFKHSYKNLDRTNAKKQRWQLTNIVITLFVLENACLTLIHKSWLQSPSKAQYNSWSRKPQWLLLQAHHGTFNPYHALKHSSFTHKEIALQHNHCTHHISHNEYHSSSCRKHLLAHVLLRLCLSSGARWKWQAVSLSNWTGKREFVPTALGFSNCYAHPMQRHRKTCADCPLWQDGTSGSPW